MHNIRPLSLLAAIALALTLAAIFTPFARAATWIVTTTNDAGAGSLRQAILDAAASGDVINFSAGLSGKTIPLSSSLVMNKNLAIDASGLTGGVALDGRHASRIFAVNGGYTWSFTRLTFVDGSGNYGGAINNQGGYVTLSQCTLSGNSALGGAIWQQSGGTLVLNQCTLSGNYSADVGGAIGLIAGTLSLDQCTIAGNSAVSGGGIYSGSGTFALTNSIVAGNSGGNIYGTFLGPNNFTSGDPLLAPLANYGGPTATRPPLAGSPVINAGAATTSTTDQRGFPRLVGSAPDIGAVEAGLPTQISVEQPAGTVLQNGTASIGFGSVGVSLTTNAVKTFTVRNTGANQTWLTAITGGANAGDFTVGAPGVMPLPPGASTTLTVTFAPTAVGARSAVLQVFSDGSFSPFSINLTGTGVGPEIGVQQPAGADLLDGTASINFGVVDTGTSSARTFLITNASLGDLTGLVITKDGANPGFFSVGALGATNLFPGASTTFTVTFTPGDLGLYGAALHIASNDSDENTFDINLIGTGLGPEIGVQQPAGIDLFDGAASISFGTVGIGIPGATKTFLITNSGNSNLILTNFTKDGANPGDFAVSALGATNLAPGAATSFTVTFTPSAFGTRSAALHIANNDSNENPFDLALVGSVTIVSTSSNSGPGSLRQIIADAPNGVTITFDPSLSGKTMLLTSPLVLDKDLAIDASGLTAGVTLDGGHATRIFTVGGGRTCSFTRLTLANGSNTPDGGAINNQGGYVTLSQCTLSGNSSIGRGGAIHQDGGTVVLNQCTLSGNSTVQLGGAINATYGTLVLNQCTLFGNYSTGAGGAIAGYATAMSLDQCTISGNLANNAYYQSGGILTQFTPTIALTNCIVAGNIGGGNLNSTFVGFNNLTSGDPLLAPLGNYGGPTATMPPLLGSPAIDAGSDSANRFATDQRGVGFPRRLGRQVDIGAVEYPSPPVLTGLTRLGDGSFRFGFNDRSGMLFWVLTATNIASPASNWILLGAPIEGPPGYYQFTDPQAAGPATRQRFYRVVAGPTNLVWIPPGTFTMGSPLTEAERNEIEGPQTVVTLTRGFFMGKYEVTQGEYAEVMGSNPSHFRNGVTGCCGGTGDAVTNDVRHPVENVVRSDATNFCAALTARERVAGRLPAGWVYRLPTEAEWEYASRAGTTNAFYYGRKLRSGMANFQGQKEYDSTLGTIDNPGGIYLGRTTVVGSYEPNGWGLYDMHGNVWEWVSDWYSASLLGGAVLDPQGPASGLYRVMRGGDWSGDARFSRSAQRAALLEEWRLGTGFRVVLSPGQ